MIGNNCVRKGSHRRLMECSLGLTLTALKYFCINHGDKSFFFNFINILVIFFCFI